MRPSTPPQARTRTGGRVLVVEDEDLLAGTLRRLLEAAGHQVVAVVFSGEDAVRTALSTKPDLILMDVTLQGGMDGVEAALKIRSALDVPILFLTGDAEAETLARAKRASPHGYLIKPFDARELEMLVETIVSRHRLESELKRSNSRFRALIAAFPDRILRVRPNGTLVDDPSGAQDVDAALGAAAGASVRGCVRRALESDAPARLEFEVADGERSRHYEVLAVGVDREEVLAVCREITEQRAAMRRAAESMKRLHEVAQKLQAAREEERRQVAREIHDELGQCLVGLKMEASSCLSDPRADPAMRARLKSMLGTVDKTIDEVRRITTKLRPLILDDLGLAAALEWLVQDFERKSGVRCRLYCDEGLEADIGRSTAVFRIVQEALTNVARHAAASSAVVMVKSSPEGLHVSVRDNGKGFDAQSQKPGHGLMGMRERAATWGGDVHLTSIPSKGTIVTVIIPASPKTP